MRSTTSPSMTFLRMSLSHGWLDESEPLARTKRALRASIRLETGGGNRKNLQAVGVGFQEDGEVGFGLHASGFRKRGKKTFRLQASGHRQPGNRLQAKRQKAAGGRTVGGEIRLAA